LNLGIVEQQLDEKVDHQGLVVHDEKPAARREFRDRPGAALAEEAMELLQGDSMVPARRPDRGQAAVADPAPERGRGYSQCSAACRDSGSSAGPNATRFHFSDFSLFSR